MGQRALVVAGCAMEPCLCHPDVNLVAGGASISGFQWLQVLYGSLVRQQASSSFCHHYRRGQLLHERQWGFDLESKGCVLCVIPYSFTALTVVITGVWNLFETFLHSEVLIFMFLRQKWMGLYRKT